MRPRWHPMLSPKLVLVLALFFGVTAHAGFAQVFSLDPAAPSLGGGSAASLFTPGPTLYVKPAAIGLLAADNVDALSFGFDIIAPPTVAFSTDWFAAGAPVAGNQLCNEAGPACGAPAPCAPEPAADLFVAFGAGVSGHLFDGDGIPGTGAPLGLLECAPPGPGGQDNVDAFDNLVAPLLASGSPAWRTYFSLAPGSPTLAGANPLLPGGGDPADILVYDSVQKTLSVFFSVTGLGLSAGADDIDGIAFDVLTSDLLFSLAPGSFSLGALLGCPCSPGDFIRSKGPICGASPCLGGGVPFASAGLRPGDNVDAVDEQGAATLYTPVQSKIYSVHRSSPVLSAIHVSPPGRSGSGADILTAAPRNPTGAPTVVIPAESLGLVPADDIDGLSFGDEPVASAGSPFTVDFSVDRLASGAAGTGVATETGAPTGREAAADIFSSFIPAGAPPLFAGTNRPGWDGNGTSAPLLHLRDIPLNLALGDDLDALEGPPILLDIDGDGVRDRPVFFSLAPGSPTLGLIGATPADILVCPAPACPVPTIHTTGAALGLVPGDNLEDFCFHRPTGVVNFTLQAGAPTLGALGADAGAVLRGGPGIVYRSSAFGLLPGAFGDNMNALDCTVPVTACVRIAPGADPKIAVSKGPCTPALAAGPYDVIEGDVREITELAGLDLGHAFCRADELVADKLELRGGMDATHARFILARNGAGAQADYGVSSAGNLRFPSVGGCP